MICFRLPPAPRTSRHCSRLAPPSHRVFRRLPPHPVTETCLRYSPIREVAGFEPRQGACLQSRHRPLVQRWASVLPLLLFALGLFAQAPPNDLFANRTPLVGTNLIATGSNTNATKEPGEPNHAGNIGRKSGWWTWTAPTNGDLTITTDGSTQSDGTPLDT